MNLLKSWQKTSCWGNAYYPANRNTKAEPKWLLFSAYWPLSACVCSCVFVNVFVCISFRVGVRPDMCLQVLHQIEGEMKSFSQWHPIHYTSNCEFSINTAAHTVALTGWFFVWPLSPHCDQYKMTNLVQVMLSHLPLSVYRISLQLARIAGTHHSTCSHVAALVN